MPFIKGHKINKGKRYSPERRLNMSLAMKGKKRSADFSNKISSLIRQQWKDGIRKGHSQEKMGLKIRGDNHHNWKGGITPANKQIRKSLEYKLWRKSVFERDDYTCVWCGQRGVKLHADHIKPFALFPELRLAIDNGRTLCVPCHKTTDTYAGRTK